MSDPKSPLIISCPPEVLTLAQNFHEHADDYKSGKYNEAQLRRYVWKEEHNFILLQDTLFG